jgi:hypothetical protein
MNNASCICTSPSAPGTNSAGTALSSSGGAAGVKEKGPALGTSDAAIDAEDQRVAKMIHSIRKAC